LKLYSCTSPIYWNVASNQESSPK